MRLKVNSYCYNYCFVCINGTNIVSKHSDGHLIFEPLYNHGRYESLIKLLHVSLHCSKEKLCQPECVCICINLLINYYSLAFVWMSTGNPFFYVCQKEFHKFGFQMKYLEISCQWFYESASFVMPHRRHCSLALYPAKLCSVNELYNMFLSCLILHSITVIWPVCNPSSVTGTSYLSLLITQMAQGRAGEEFKDS